MVQENYMCSWTDHSNYFFNSISSLRLNEILTDVTITCGDKYFQAHKLVLCASSEYFRSILANNIEKLAIVHIVGVPPVYIHNILQYLYTGQIEITPSDVEPFLRVANDLKICGLYKDDPNFMPISEPDPEPDPEPVDPVEQGESSYSNSSLSFIPTLDPTLRTRFKNPIPLDELRIKKKMRGSEPTLGNSLPTNIVESRSSSEEKAMEQTDGHMEHSAAAAALSSLANAAANAAKEEAITNGIASREEITILPDIVDLNEETDEISRDNKENLTSGSGQSSRGVSPRGHSPSLAALENAAGMANAVQRAMSSSPGINVTSGGGGSPITFVSMADLSERRPNPNYITTSSSSMAQFPIRTNALAVDPAAVAVSVAEAAAAVIKTRSASMNKRKSIPTKLDTSLADKKTRIEISCSPHIPVSLPLASHSPVSSSASSAAAPTPPPLSLLPTQGATIVPMSASSPLMSPLTSLTTSSLNSSLNSPYLRSSSNPCKGLTPLNCRKGHNGNHCNHVIIPLPDGRKAHYSKQEYEAWLKTA